VTRDKPIDWTIGAARVAADAMAERQNTIKIGSANKKYRSSVMPDIRSPLVNLPSVSLAPKRSRGLHTRHGQTPDRRKGEHPSEPTAAKSALSRACYCRP